MPRYAEPTPEEIERERAITRWNLYRAVKNRIQNTFNDPGTLKPKYCFTPELEAKCQRILRHAEETLRFLIPLASAEMYSDSYEPPQTYRPTLTERLMFWRRMGIARLEPDGAYVFRPISWRDIPTLLRRLPALRMLFWN